MSSAHPEVLNGHDKGEVQMRCHRSSVSTTGLEESGRLSGQNSMTVVVLSTDKVAQSWYGTHPLGEENNHDVVDHHPCIK